MRCRWHRLPRTRRFTRLERPRPTSPGNRSSQSSLDTLYAAGLPRPTVARSRPSRPAAWPPAWPSHSTSTSGRSTISIRGGWRGACRWRPTSSSASTPGRAGRPAASGRGSRCSGCPTRSPRSAPSRTSWPTRSVGSRWRRSSSASRGSSCASPTTRSSRRTSAGCSPGSPARASSCGPSPSRWSTSSRPAGRWPTAADRARTTRSGWGTCPGLTRVLGPTINVVTAVLLVWVAFVLWRKSWSTPLRRRLLAPILGNVVLLALGYAAYTLLRGAGAELAEPVRIIGAAAAIAVPVAMLLGQVRGRVFAATSLGQLVASLGGEAATPVRLELLLRELLGDPKLTLLVTSTGGVELRRRARPTGRAAGRARSRRRHHRQACRDPGGRRDPRRRAQGPGRHGLDRGHRVDAPAQRRAGGRPAGVARPHRGRRPARAAAARAEPARRRPAAAAGHPDAAGRGGRQPRRGTARGARGDPARRWRRRPASSSTWPTGCTRRCCASEGWPTACGPAPGAPRCPYG